MAKNTTFLYSRQFLKLSALMSVFISFFSLGQTSQTFNTPGTYTFTVPEGVNTIKVEAWGSGSGGNNDNSRGGGGGAFAGDNTLAVTPGASYTVRVGSGGAAGTGNSGQDSSFGNLIVAKGGNGATGGAASASTGAIRYSGGNGGASSGNGGAGGGGSAGLQGAGGNGGNTSNANGAAGGTAGAGGGAAGGNGGNTNNNGGNGAFPGGGGGERGSNGTSIGSGAGGNGQLIITYTPAYVAQIISTDTGSTTWCAGETRNVSVTIKNIGSLAWTDVPGTGGKDFNIGIKWNQNSGSWSDYNVRVDAGNLAPGATKTYTFTITASNNVSGAYTTPLSAGTNNLNFDVVYEGVAWFGNNPGGATGVGPGNAVFTTSNQTITAVTSVSNNILSYTNGTSGQRSATANENGNAVLSSPPAGSYFSSVNFASYGTPGGTTPNFVINTACHSTESQSVAENYLLGNSSAVTIPATNAVFGDPCVGTGKRLYVLASYVQPICSGSTITITGTTPTGGNGSYTYQWERSTTSATSGFVAETGKTAKDYSGTITTTTWFRRFVTSGCSNGYSSVVMVKVNPTPAVPVVSAAAATCNIPGTATISNYVAGSTYTFTPSGPSVGSSGTISGLTPGINYTVTSGNGNCTSAASTSFSVAAQNPTPVVATVTVTAPTCSAPGTAVISNYSAGLTYTFAPSGPSVNSGGVITGFTYGTSYTVTARNAAGCSSVSSVPFTVAAQLITPAVPIINTAAATCNAQGTATVSNYAATNTYTFTPSGPTVGSGGVVSGLVAGTSYTVTSGNGSCISVASSSFSVAPKVPAPTGILTSATGTDRQILCSNTALTPITYSTTGIISATVSGLPAGVTGGFASNVFSISGTPSVSGTFNYTVTLTGVCGTITETGMITVNPTPSAAVSAIGSGQICTPTDVIFNIVGSPAATVIYQLNGGTPVSLTLPASGTAQVTVSAASVSQTLTLISISNGTCTALLSGSSSTATVSFSVTTWNGTDWDNGLPDNTKMAVFAADYSTQLGNITACGCQTNPGITLTIDDGDFIEILRNIFNNGNIVIKSNGNLLQKSENGTYIAGAATKFTVERSVSGVKNNLSTGMDYIYWSSPVSGQNLQDFSPGTPRNRIFEYNEATDLFKQAPESAFINGKGYAFRAEGGLSNPYAKTYIFTGVPNNGLITRGVIKSPNTGTGGTVEHGYNLIGNPYPSNINVDQFFINNASVIHGTAWLWTNASYTMNQQGGNYSGNNYAVYNGTGGTGATGGSVAPNGIIKVGQGFLVQAKTTGTVVFKNSYGAGDDLRVADAGTFYQKGNAKNRFWLQLVSPNNVLNSQLIGYIPGATHGYEQDYDAEIMGMSSDVFYSKTGDRKLLIQGKGLFNDTDEVVLGANFFQNGNYTISLHQAEGIFASGQDIYLKDRLLNTVTNLRAGSYTFAANKGLSEGRFEIVYRPGAVLSAGNSSKDVLEVYRDADDFVVRSSHKKISLVEVFDASGRLAHSYAATGKQTVVPAQTLANGIYILKITLENGEQVQRKIVK